ncbi:MAG: putative porin [Limisphaerales bacterium]|jgi:predicted porin
MPSANNYNHTVEMDMIGGLMKTTSRLTIATAFAAFATTGAMAADLGGNCCSDLEERVAELEATTARKGNRKVSLEVSGQVNRVVVWHNDSDSRVSKFTSRDNDGRSGSRFRFKGSAKIDSNWSAGFLIEIGVDNNESAATNDRAAAALATQERAGVLFRHTMLYVKNKRLGTLRLGRTNTAAEGITEICLGCAITPNSGEEGGQVSGIVGRTMLGIDGTRRNGVHYVSPELGGFVLYSSWFHVGDPGQQNDGTAKSNNDAWDIAVRYANEFNGIRVAAGIAYSEAEGGAGTGEIETISGSASMLHVASGLVLQGSAGQVENKAGVKSDTWYLSGGVSRKFNPIGKTTMTVGYGQADKAGIDTTNYGVGISQNVDAAAMDIYGNWRHYDDGTATDNEVDIFTVGARIRF